MNFLYLIGCVGWVAGFVITFSLMSDIRGGFFKGPFGVMTPFVILFTWPLWAAVFVTAAIRVEEEREADLAESDEEGFSVPPTKDIHHE